MNRCVSLVVLLTTITACATTPVQRRTAPAGLRAVGTVRLVEPGGQLRFDVALRGGRPGLRLDVATPVGSLAALAWIERERWLVVDMQRGEAWTGSIGELQEAWPRLDLRLRAVLLLGTVPYLLNRAHGFGTIFPIPPWSGTAVALGPGRWRLEPLDGAWTLAVTGPDLAADGVRWPRTWRLARAWLDLEVTWQRWEPLDAAAVTALRPRIPPGLRVHSLSSSP